MAAHINTLPLYDWTYSGQGNVSDCPVSVPPLFYQLIADRGFLNENTDAAINSFLDAKLATLGNPLAVPGVKEAVNLLIDAIRSNGKILIYGDFDCDGISATTIMLRVLKFLKADVSHFIPLRSEGYGFTDASVGRCLSAGVPSLLLTVDCGITAGPYLKRFLDLGCKVIVSDHHTHGEPLPPECVVVSPHNDGVPESCLNLCGAGVAYKIASGLIATLYPLPDRTGRPLLYSLLDVLAVATVADVVPLTGENRIYVRNGLNILKGPCNIGLAALLKKSLKINPEEFTPYHVGFIIAPNINASGRMASAELALELLTTEDRDVAWNNAIKLNNLNAERKQVETEMLKSAEEQLKNESIFKIDEDGAIVVAQKGWHPGVAGIAAARIMETYNRPVAVISIDENGEGHGSVRAPEGYNANTALKECSDLLVRFGGHANAAGLAINEDAIPDFRNKFKQICEKQVGAISVRNTLEIAGKLSFGDISMEFTKWLKRLEPCGQGNPPPIWEISHATVKTRIIGKNSEHLRLEITREDGVSIGGIWYGAAKFVPQISKHTFWDIAGRLEENDFNNEVTLQIAVTDMRPAGEE